LGLVGLEDSTHPTNYKPDSLGRIMYKSGQGATFGGLLGGTALAGW